MSAACSGTSEHHFLCSICLEVFTDPVTTPCGHNFCESCISTHWDTNVGHTCPMCNQRFSIKPQLKVNTLMRDVVSQFRREAAAPGEVPCDVCTGTKVKALKSCLDCVLSYCETHLDLHLTASGLRRHQLVEPVENLETRMCPKHSKPLEMFCKCDQTCVCLICSVMEHKSHQLKVELEKIEADLQQMIQKRREKLEKIRESARIRKIVADREKAEAKQSFSSGRFYFEVQVKGKTDWDFGVASETIDRKGPTVLSPQNGYWSLFLTNGNVYGTSNSHEQLDLKSVPEKVGVFVDYEEGVVSFYDVDAAALIYSFTNCCFTNELFPFFCPCFYGGGKNISVMIVGSLSSPTFGLQDPLEGEHLLKTSS
uniref:E3 ubiquitin-protein ligase TRIM39-like n=1 Tax=Gouania willdenowi TaxID=441366 RepID=A0A8C5HCI2_GOUWI